MIFCLNHSKKLLNDRELSYLGSRDKNLFKKKSVFKSCNLRRTKSKSLGQKIFLVIFSKRFIFQYSPILTQGSQFVIPVLLGCTVYARNQSIKIGQNRFRLTYYVHQAFLLLMTEACLFFFSLVHFVTGKYRA